MVRSTSAPCDSGRNLPNGEESSNTSKSSARLKAWERTKHMPTDAVLDIASEKPPSNAVCPTPNTPATLSRPAEGSGSKRNRTCVEPGEYHLHSCQTSPPLG